MAGPFLGRHAEHACHGRQVHHRRGQRTGRETRGAGDECRRPESPPAPFLTLVGHMLEIRKLHAQLRQPAQHNDQRLDAPKHPDLLGTQQRNQERDQQNRLDGENGVSPEIALAVMDQLAPVLIQHYLTMTIWPVMR